MCHTIARVRAPAPAQLAYGFEGADEQISQTLPCYDYVSAAALTGIRRAPSTGLLDPEKSRRAGIAGILTSHGLKSRRALTGAFPLPLKVEGMQEVLRSSFELCYE